MRKFSLFITRFILSVFYRVEIIGQENIPETGAAILCANHTSQLDMLFLGSKIKRWIHWMAKEELFQNPLIGKFLSTLGAFPVKRGKGDVGSIKYALRLLEEQKIVGIFPEGTRVKKSFRGKAKIKPGVALIAINAQVPIIPAAIVGNNKPFSHVKVIFGKPFQLDIDKNNKYTKDELYILSQQIMEKVYELMEEN